MKNFLYNVLVLFGKLWVMIVLIGVIALIIPLWILLEFVSYMEKVTKLRSQRALTEYID